MADGNALPEPLAAKRAAVLAGLRATGGAVTALSGGVDSSLLACLAAEALGDRALAATVEGPLLPASARARVARLVRERGLRHRFVPVDVLALPAVRGNARDRCYHCKRALGRALRALADAGGLPAVLHGANADDAGEHRPGARAAREEGLRAPLADAGLGKAELRTLADALGLAPWNRPADACLATRFPYGTALDAGALARVDAAEDALRALGVDEPLRVRAHGELARIEVGPDMAARLAGPLAARAAGALRGLGFAHVAVDLAGYRRGVFDA